MAHLRPPVGEHDHVQGPDDAPVTLVEYGDYECPYCGQAYPIVKQLQSKLGNRLRFVFRNFPLSEAHPHAQHAAEAAETAAQHGMFWEMHDLLYEHQHALDDVHLLSYGESLGLDAWEFSSAIEEHKAYNRVHEDFTSGVRSGVNGTPSFFINGERYDDSWDADTLLQALENASREREAVDR